MILYKLDMRQITKLDFRNNNKQTGSHKSPWIIRFSHYFSMQNKEIKNNTEVKRKHETENACPS